MIKIKPMWALLVAPIIASAADLGFTASEAAIWDEHDEESEAVIRCITITMPEDGTANSIKAYIRESADPNEHDWIGAIRTTGDATIANGATDCVSTVGTSYSFVTFPFSTPPTLSADTSYKLCIAVGGGNGAGFMRGGYLTPCSDPPSGVSCGAPFKYYAGPYPCTAMSDSDTTTGDDNDSLGLYLDYTPAGGGSSTRPWLYIQH